MSLGFSQVIRVTSLGLWAWHSLFPSQQLTGQMDSWCQNDGCYWQTAEQENFDQTLKIMQPKNVCNCNLLINEQWKCMRVKIVCLCHCVCALYHFRAKGCPTRVQSQFMTLIIIVYGPLRRYCACVSYHFGRVGHSTTSHKRLQRLHCSYVRGIPPITTATRVTRLLNPPSWIC